MCALMQAVLSHLSTWGLPAAGLVLDPLLPPHADYYSGILLQVRLSTANDLCYIIVW